MPSSEAIKKWSGDPIRLLWIDGNHDYDLWSPSLIKGGILAFHDATITSPWTDPRKLVEEISKTNLYTPFNVVRDGIAWAQKL